MALSFPSFADGRAFSTARILRERYGFAGEIRAVGDVQIDRYQFMRQCGFDAFEIRPERADTQLGAGRDRDEPDLPARLCRAARCRGGLARPSAAAGAGGRVAFVAHEPSALAAGLACRCPACGRGRLFAGYLKVRSPCEGCGADLAAYDNDDGPAAFLILAVGFVNVFGALIFEARYAPPAWVHFSIWLPFTVVAVLALLRPFKGVRVALQYKNRAATVSSPVGASSGPSWL